MVGPPAAGDLRERRLIATFVELADTLVEDFDLVDFLGSLTTHVVGLGLADEAGILLVDEAGDLQFVAASHERAQLLELFQVQNQQGPCQECFTTGEPVGVDDLEAERGRWPRFADRALDSGFRSVEAVPMRLRGTVLGALNLFLTRTGGLPDDALAVVQAMADVATISLLQQRALHRSHDVEAQLQHALHSRISVEQAKGMVSEQASVPMDVAFELLRAHARRTNEKLSAVARHVVEGGLTGADLGDRA
jgi:transcriptional regulator with GAF, ATPase, and Fis domain